MVTYRLHDGGDVVDVVGSLAELYAVVYAEPPYEEGPEDVRRFVDRLHDDMSRVGFALITADDGVRLVGAAYGWTMLSGVWWSRAGQEPPVEVREAAKLAVMEWIVHPDRRGEGIGRELMCRLLDGRAESYATLAANPRAAARRIYARAGWRQVGTSRMPDGTPMDLLVLELNASGGDT